MIVFLSIHEQKEVSYYSVHARLPRDVGEEGVVVWPAALGDAVPGDVPLLSHPETVGRRGEADPVDRGPQADGGPPVHQRYVVAVIDTHKKYSKVCTVYQ